jgi:hypothetical protein
MPTGGCMPDDPRVLLSARQVETLFIATAKRSTS